MSLKCPACHGSNTKRAGMGIGAAILVLAGLAMFGGGKKPDTQEAAAPEVATASAVAESTASDISTAPNAQVLAAEAASATITSSEALSQPQPIAASQGCLSEANKRHCRPKQKNAQTV